MSSLSYIPVAYKEAYFKINYTPQEDGKRILEKRFSVEIDPIENEGEKRALEGILKSVQEEALEKCAEYLDSEKAEIRFTAQRFILYFEVSDSPNRNVRRAITEIKAALIRRNFGIKWQDKYFADREAEKRRNYEKMAARLHPELTQKQELERCVLS